MTEYKFRQGIDYGVRKGTLGLVIHMAEGGDGTLAYLAKRATETVAQWKVRVRGVSANAVILTDGTVWNMVEWGHASGSLNPNDRNPSTTGYYNGTVIKAVLGDKYVDPNAYSISVEICGYRAQGPTAAQVKGAIAWGLDMRSRFPTLRGAYGHHDQTDTKGCPGTTANMKAIFEGVGGHGLFTEEEPLEAPVLPKIPTLVMVKAGAKLYDNSALTPNANTITVEPAGRNMPLVESFAVSPALRVVRYITETGIDTGLAYYMLATDGGVQTAAPLPVGPPDAVSCKPFVDEAIVTDRAKARVTWA